MSSGPGFAKPTACSRTSATASRRHQLRRVRRPLRQFDQLPVADVCRLGRCAPSTRSSTRAPPSRPSAGIPRVIYANGPATFGLTYAYHGDFAGTRWRRSLGLNDQQAWRIAGKWNFGKWLIAGYWDQAKYKFQGNQIPSTLRRPADLQVPELGARRAVLHGPVDVRRAVQLRATTVSPARTTARPTPTTRSYVNLTQLEPGRRRARRADDRLRAVEAHDAALLRRLDGERRHAGRQPRGHRISSDGGTARSGRCPAASGTRSDPRPHGRGSLRERALRRPFSFAAGAGATSRRHVRTSRDSRHPSRCNTAPAAHLRSGCRNAQKALDGGNIRPMKPGLLRAPCRRPRRAIARSARAAGRGAAGPASALYGTLNLDVEAVRGQQPDGSNPTTVRVSSNSSRFGFRGTESLGGGLAAIFQIESAISADDGGGDAAAARNVRRAAGRLGHGQARLLPRARTTTSTPLFGNVPTLTHVDPVDGGAVGAGRAVQGQRRLRRAAGQLDPLRLAALRRLHRQRPGLARRGRAAPSSATAHALSAGGVLRDGPAPGRLAYERNNEVRGAGSNDQALSVAGSWNFGIVRVGGVYERLDYDTPTGDLTRNFWGCRAHGRARARARSTRSTAAPATAAARGDGHARRQPRARAPTPARSSAMVSYTYRAVEAHDGLRGLRAHRATTPTRLQLLHQPVPGRRRRRQDSGAGFVLGTAHSF